jgi:HD-like signal output (HDOD) protein
MTISPLSEEKLLVIAKSLPVAPQIMARLHKMLLDTDSGLEDIAALLKRDVSLSTRILRIANSAAYNGGKIGSIEEALQRVGYDEVFRLVGVAAIAAVSDTNLRCYGYTGQQFHAHNLCTALVSEAIARHTCSDTSLAYIAGLLSCIGQILLDRSGRDHVGSGEAFAEVGGGELSEWERRVFGVTHFHVSRVLLDHWGFPGAVVEAVGHDPSLKGAPTALAQHLKLARSIVGLAGYGLAGANAVWSIPRVELGAAGLTVEDANLIQEESIATLQTLLAA